MAQNTDFDALFEDLDSEEIDEITTRVLELAREECRDEKRADSEKDIADGVRVDPAPLTFKGAIVKVHIRHLDGGEGDVQGAISRACGDSERFEIFSTSTNYDGYWSAAMYSEGFWCAAVKDMERMGL